MNKKLNSYAMALLVGTGLITMTPAAQAADMEVSADVGVFSSYVWRGAKFSGDAPSVQGDFGMDFAKGLSGNVWYATNLVDNGTEFDYTLDYSGEAGVLGYSVGVIAYRFLNQKSFNTLEAYAGISAGPASLTVYYDTKLFKKDMYIEAGIDGELGSFAASASVGYVMPNVGKKEVSNVTLGVSKDFELKGGVTATPSFTYVAGLGPNKGVKALTGANAGDTTSKGDQIVAGINFAY